MTDELNCDELNTSIESVITQGEAASTGNEEVDALARLASGLRGLPDPGFKARLSAELMPARGRARWWSFWTARPARPEARAAEAASQGGLLNRARRLLGQPWFRRNRPFVAAGAGYGLLAGTCCISGAVASVFGLASAAAISSFIDGALPYFVGLSVVGLVVWLLLRVVREQGLTPAAVATTLRRHGAAMASSYAVVFGASMGLAMAMGLY